MDRLRLTIDAAMHLKSVLFLIEEIFIGTNSRDRRIANSTRIPNSGTSTAIFLRPCNPPGRTLLFLPERNSAAEPEAISGSNTYTR